MPETSIIIRTKNEEKWIGECLKRIFSQTYQDFEVIIVDSGSTDKTLEIIKEFNVKLFQIKPEEFSYPFALNYGCKRTTATKYFVFLSAHSLPVSKTWLEDGIKNFNIYDNLAGVYGGIWALPDGSFFEKISLNKPLDIIKQSFRKNILVKRPIMGVLGFTNAIIRRDLWDKHHLDEAYGIGGEDGEWANYWFQRGFIAVKDIRFSVYHSHGLGLKQLIQQRKYWISSSGKPQPFRHLEFRKKQS